MSQVNKRMEKLFADALTREGLWFVPQARCRMRSGHQHIADFFLRTKKGAGIIIAIGGPDLRTPITAAGYRYHWIDPELVKKEPRKVARSVKQRFNPETSLENRKKVRARLAEIRAEFKRYDRESVGKMSNKRGTRS